MYITQKHYSIQSGGPDKGGSLKRELTAKLSGAVKRGGLTGAGGGIIIAALELMGGGNLREGAETMLGYSAAGAIACAIASSLSVLGADARKAKTYDLTSEKLHEMLVSDQFISKFISMDKDPSKFKVNLSFLDDKLVLYILNPTNPLLSSLNEGLEILVKYNRKADYTAAPTKDGFLVFIEVPSVNEAFNFLYDVIYKEKVYVNVLTDKSLSKVKINEH